MSDLPFAIPESLASYAVHFESSPDKAIQRLKKQLGKRGPDAVGYFLLGWFYHRQGLQEKAIKCALKAKNFAPGSPFFDKLHYFFAHPNLFQAWEHSDNRGSRKKRYQSKQSAGPIYDLDTLIEKLSAMNSSRIQNEDTVTSDTGSNMSSDSDVDDIVSETLARIHEEQGKIDAAIKAYKRLKKYNTHKSNYYNKQIKRLEKIKDEETD